MRLDMFIEIRLLAVGFSADVAWKWLLARMDLHVHTQTGCLREAFVAQLALKWLLAGVDAHVDVEAAGLSERTIAEGTGKRLLTHMAFHMLYQLRTGLERLPANGALIDQLLCVHAHVLVQQCLRLELTFTLRARVTLDRRRMRLLVQQQ